MQAPDNEPAFPVPYSNEADGPTIMPTHGMTLRDYFAAKAMAALIADPGRVDQSRTECARLAYAMADAMLAERAKVQP